METRLVIFLAFTSVTVVANALLFWFLYRAFAKVTVNVTETIRQFEADDSTRSWLRSMEAASAQAVSVTESTKKQIDDYKPTMQRAEDRYSEMLQAASGRVDELCTKLASGAEKMREGVVKPAEKIESIAEGIHRAVGSFLNTPQQPDEKTDAGSTKQR
jgi:hypothetical protein